ncbi:hypothetical protein PF006_g155 [Phytophthora fragariae]|uniref:BROMI C-terminal Rab TBC-like domain-containing protein n=1 Tax=Phytophthora fragariae TaxID=53985 RepID=A0A6A3UVI1_9STRA|nr:hypothetical protein PF006_g155 [Phytophthora fragariae]
MARLEATGALEELLRQQRSLVDQTLYPLLEDAPLGDLLQHFQSTLLALQSQEPSFWQLQVVEFIRNFLKTRVGGCVRDAVRSAASGELQDPEQVVASVRAHVETSCELEDALRQLSSDVEREVNRLTELLSADKENRRRFEDTDDHFLDQFWSRLQKLADTREWQPKSDEEREAEEVEESESCSFEILTFDDDLNDVSRSAVSFPCMEDFPGTIIRMQSTDALERATGLDELMQMPIVEVIHSGPIFPAACSAVVGLFLDIGDIRGVGCDTAERAKSVIFDLMNQVEDAAQFLELYGAVLEFVGLHLEAGKLYLDRQSIFESTDAHSVAVLDCFRVLHALICRVTRHWVYFSSDALARMMYSTFYLLTMYSNTETEVEVKRVSPLLMMSLIDDCPVQWFRLWLLNCPSTRQLFVAMEESGFIADLLQYMSRVRPLALRRLSTGSTDAIEKRAVQSALIVLSYICEYQEGRELLSRWKRVSAHAFIKQRHTSWGRPALETIAAENDSLFRSVQPETTCQDQQEELDADYEHLGAGAVDALILSIASVIVTLPIHSQEIVYVPYDEKWTKAISNSAATYLHAAHGDDLTAVLVKIIDSGWTHSLSSDYSTTELEENNPWFPFRQPKGATEVYLQLLNLAAKSSQQRDVLCSDSELLGSCSLLEKQLRYAFEFVGGSNERILRCELYAFDGHSRQNGSTDTTHVKEPVIKEASDFIITLHNKILQALQDGIKTGSSVPMDFVLISQASWEMINDLETKSVVSTSFGPYRSAASFTEVFAKLMYNLITSNRSRVEVSANSTDVGEMDATAVTCSGQDFAEFFPTDSERKLMNRLYKNYASGLSLDSSPTLLHCIVKKFGRVAMDCFPVTMLMILYPTYGEADILQFLSHCLTSSSGCFLWPRSAATCGDEVDAGNVVSPAMLIAEGVEIIMEREFPLVLQAIDQRQCSLSSLVLRWHTQSFWNYFDWENIVIYTYFSILYGAEFQVYIIVAILKHLEPTMRDLTASHNTQSLLPFLTLIQEPIRNFRFSQWRALLLRLRSEYHEEVRAILLSHKTEQERT